VAGARVLRAARARAGGDDRPSLGEVRRLAGTGDPQVIALGRIRPVRIRPGGAPSGRVVVGAQLRQRALRPDDGALSRWAWRATTRSRQCKNLVDVGQGTAARARASCSNGTPPTIPEIGEQHGARRAAPPQEGQIPETY
jgi:hypothetical protein